MLEKAPRTSSDGNAASHHTGFRSCEGTAELPAFFLPASDDALCARMHLPTIRPRISRPHDIGTACRKRRIDACWTTHGSPDRTRAVHWMQDIGIAWETEKNVSGRRKALFRARHTICIRSRRVGAFFFFFFFVFLFFFFFFFLFCACARSRSRRRNIEIPLRLAGAGAVGSRARHPRGAGAAGRRASNDIAARTLHPGSRGFQVNIERGGVGGGVLARPLPLGPNAEVLVKVRAAAPQYRRGCCSWR